MFATTFTFIDFPAIGDEGGADCTLASSIDSLIVMAEHGRNDEWYCRNLHTPPIHRVDVVGSTWPKPSDSDLDIGGYPQFQFHSPMSCVSLPKRELMALMVWLGDEKRSGTLQYADIRNLRRAKDFRGTPIY